MRPAPHPGHAESGLLFGTCPPAGPDACAQKKRGGLVVILILALLAVGGYFLYNYLGPFGGDPGDNLRDGTEPRESVLPDGDDDSNTMTNKEYRDWLLGD